jgi:extradiol dioxygenase family protein
MTPFHLAFLVRDIDETRRFYADVLGCEIGRSSDKWVDFSLFGHQMSAHLRRDGAVAARDENFALRAGRTVPIPHFGVVLLMDEWERLAKKLEGYSATDWVQRPTIRFKGKPGEQATLFIRDPSGNPIEFKGFRSLEQAVAH